MSRTLAQAARTLGSRAAHSFTPNARYEAIWSQYSKAGLAVRNSPLKVGVIQLPRTSISRAASAFSPSSMSHRLCVPRLGSVSAAVTASSSRQ